MKTNHCAIILNQLMRHGVMTQEMARRLGIVNLSARINELRKLGLKITTGHKEYRMNSTRPAKKQLIHFEDDLFPDYNPNE